VYREISVRAVKWLFSDSREQSTGRSPFGQCGDFTISPNAPVTVPSKIAERSGGHVQVRDDGHRDITVGLQVTVAGGISSALHCVTRRCLQREYSLGISYVKCTSVYSSVSYSVPLTTARS
jgi:hypothetical protein